MGPSCVESAEGRSGGIRGRAGLSLPVHALGGRGPFGACQKPDDREGLAGHYWGIELSWFGCISQHVLF